MPQPGHSIAEGWFRDGDGVEIRDGPQNTSLLRHGVGIGTDTGHAGRGPAAGSPGSGQP